MLLKTGQLLLIALRLRSRLFPNQKALPEQPSRLPASSGIAPFLAHHMWPLLPSLPRPCLLQELDTFCSLCLKFCWFSQSCFFFLLFFSHLLFLSLFFLLFFLFSPTFFLLYLFLFLLLLLIIIIIFWGITSHTKGPTFYISGGHTFAMHPTIKQPLRSRYKAFPEGSFSQYLPPPLREKVLWALSP